MSKKIPLISALAVPLLSAALLVSCGNGNPSADIPDAVTDAAAEETAAGSMFSWYGANYTVDGTEITAAACAPSNFDQVFSGAFYDDPLLDGDFAAEVEVTLDTIYSSGGLLFRASEAEYDGYEGYALMVRDRKIYLYEAGGSKSSGMIFTELGRASIEDYKRGTPLRLRVEREGNTFRLYFLDDADGVEPWPEFEFVLNSCRGTGIGVADNGQGVSFDSLTV
ncbi:MAG: hypothetical protein IJV76_05295, partial [Clostridia bacterium]|nr:hypothetical protein [Clostridia bacterium]